LLKWHVGYHICFIHIMNAGTLMFPTNDQVALTTELHETIAEYEKNAISLVRSASISFSRHMW
jgi:hypothetical protein